MTTGRCNSNYRAEVLPCAICGREAGDGAGWFLVAENSWLDRLKILHWHPVLAEQAEMRGVCCKQHLKILLTHWLTCANLQFLANAALRLPASQIIVHTTSESGDGLATSLVGELAIHRESLSRMWSGSAQTLECILEALLGGLAREIKEDPAELMYERRELPVFDRAVARARHYALQS